MTKRRTPTRRRDELSLADHMDLSIGPSRMGRCQADYDGRVAELRELWPENREALLARGYGGWAVENFDNNYDRRAT